VRGEERNRRVSPVIDLARWTVLRVKLKYRERLNSSDAELLQVRNFFHETREGPSLVLGDTGAGVMGEAPDVHFINDCPRRRMSERGVSFPVIAGRIRDYALHGSCDVFTEKHGIVPIISVGNHDCPAIGIEE
jgi:hypothetical protein